MALFDAPRCQHTKSNGIRCGSPALKDNLFCHYHHQCPTVVFDYHGGSFANYAESELSLPAFEDAHSIQSTVHKLVEFMLKHRIEDRKAALILYALQIASSNLKRLERELAKPEEVVTELPFDPVRAFHEERERIWQAKHAEFNKAHPPDPSPGTPENTLPSSGGVGGNS